MLNTIHLRKKNVILYWIRNLINLQCIRTEKWIIHCHTGKKSAMRSHRGTEIPPIGNMLGTLPCAPSVKFIVHIGNSRNRARCQRLLIFLTTTQQSRFLSWCPYGVSKQIVQACYFIEHLLSLYDFLFDSIYRSNLPNISISAIVFLELWKRKQAVIAWEWDLTKFEEDEPLRPQYEAKVKTTR